MEGAGAEGEYVTQRDGKPVWESLVRASGKRLIISLIDVAIDLPT